MVHNDQSYRNEKKKNEEEYVSYTIAQSTVPKRCPADDHRQHETRPISHSLSLRGLRAAALRTG